VSGGELSLFLKATGMMYLDCARRATAGLLRNWIFLVGALAAYFLLALAQMFLAPFGLAGGLVLGLIGVALLSLYYGWIIEIARKNRIAWRDLYQFDYGLFSDVMSVAFMLFLVKWLTDLTAVGSRSHWLAPCVQLGLVLVFNAIPEVIHQRRLDGVSALSYAAVFTRTNWMEWYLPLVVLVAPVLFALPSYILLVLASAEPLLPVLVIIQSWAPLHYSYGMPITLAGILVGNWFMLFRANLFLELDGGNRRRRMYRAKTAA
jgi:hypothetical protein